MRHLRTIGLGLLVGLVCAGVAFGQAQTGGITGVVKDPTGAVISGATVEIYNEQTGQLERTAKTGDDGSYVATLLRPGTYRVEITAVGFKVYKATIPVRVGDTARHNAIIEVGGAGEVVTVESAATPINTENSTLGTVIDQDKLVELPIPNPNFMYLLTLSSGTAGEPADVRGAGRTNVDINVNGQRTTNNSATLEGININDFNLAHFDTIPLPNPNALQEFKVATSNYDATMGGKGGGAVNLVLRTGSKDWHWSAYWTHRNDAFKAREWFYNKNNPTGPDQKYLQNVVGGSVSGPMPILGGFWFGNIQGLSFRNGVDSNGATATPTVPVFPTLADGTTTAALLATLIPSGNPADIDPVAVNILNLQKDFYGGTFLVPRPGQAGCGTGATTFQCTFSKVIPGEDFQHTFTYDRHFGDAHKLALRWFHDNGEFQAPFGSGGTLRQPGGNLQRNRFTTISHTWNISSRMLNEFRVGYSRFKNAITPTDLVLLSDIGATRPNEAELPGIYSLAITGLFSVGTGVNDDRGTISNAFSMADTWSWVKGKHTFRAGFDGTHFQLNRYNRFATRGSLTFGAIPGTPALTPFQGFLMGRATALQSAAGVPDRYFRATDYFMFFQDDWRIRPGLTLNLGIRWEPFEMGYETLHRLGRYEPALAAAGQNPFLFPKDVNLGGFTGIGAANATNNCTVDNCRDMNNWAPRVGLAWDIFGDQKIIFRAGYGIYYQRLSNQTTLQTNLSPPFNVQPIDSRASGLPAQVLANPFPTLPAASLINAAVIPQASFFAGLRWISTGSTGACPGTGPGVLDPNNPCVGPVFVNEDGVRCQNFGGTAPNCSINLAGFTAPLANLHAPYTQQWNATMAFDLGKGWGAEVGYVGSQYVGGIGIFNPYVQIATPSSPITVTDINGVSYTLTASTVNNEPMRHAILGLSRARGTRFAGNIGFANYQSMQASITRRFGRGLYFNGAYTWSKTIDNVSGSMSTDELNATRAGQGGANMTNFGNIDPRLNRSIGDFDRPHRLVFSYVYDIPVPKDGIWGTQIFQGWSMSGITYWQSGLPFTVTTSAAGAWGSGGINTPNFTCANISDAYNSGSMGDLVNGYLNINCFTNPQTLPGGQLDYGTMRRNQFRGPYQTNWDFAVTKAFNITERHTLKFRTEIFNVWNHPVFRAPAFVSISTPATFGQINETVVPARLIQFSLRYDF